MLKECTIITCSGSLIVDENVAGKSIFSACKGNATTLRCDVAKSGVPPFFALSLFITWFAHNLAELGQAARLFDLFIASHPLMPLYAAVAVLTACSLALPTALD